MRKRVLYSLLIVALIVLLDQVSKYLVRMYIQPFETRDVLPVVNIVNVRNKGAAFGMFGGLGNTFFVAISVAALLFICWIIVTGREDYRIFSLLAGGAAGNLTDRLVLGSVVDFIDVHVAGYHWPAFNVADSALTLGILLLGIKLLRRKE